MSGGWEQMLLSIPWDAAAQSQRYCLYLNTPDAATKNLYNTARHLLFQNGYACHTVCNDSYFLHDEKFASIWFLSAVLSQKNGSLLSEAFAHNSGSVPKGAVA